ITKKEKKASEKSDNTIKKHEDIRATKKSPASTEESDTIKILEETLIKFFKSRGIIDSDKKKGDGRYDFVDLIFGDLSFGDLNPSN
ncbi:232_t:CDS:2, partial [Gigaspora margarita]